MSKRKEKAKHGTQNYQMPVLIMSLLLVFVILVLFFRDNEEADSSYLSVLPEHKLSGSSESMVHHPTVEFRNGTELIWKIPYKPKAVLFLAHGCDGKAVNFWDKSPSCSNCVGLPEERQLVIHALARRFAVLTVSSAGRCWSLREERLVVRDIIRWWVGENNLKGLPLVALGASSGGYFVSVLATDLRFSSITLMIAEGMFDLVEVTEDYPPTLFVHMPKDRQRLQKIGENMELLRNKGIDVEDIECMEFPLSPGTLAARIPGITHELSAKLFELFREKGFIDKQGYMRNDGRRTNWKEALTETSAIFLDKQLVHHVQEELNLAYAYHEMTSLQSEQIFRWFESHMG